MTSETSKIIDNTPGRELVNVLKDRFRNCNEAKFAVGYFFLSGFDLMDRIFQKIIQKVIFLQKSQNASSSII